MRRLLIATAMATALAFPGVASAATFTVTKTADTLDGSCTPADCSLREALTAANAAGDLDDVIVPAGTYPLTLADPGDDVSGGDLDVTGPLRLLGAGARTTVLQAGGADRVLEIDSDIDVEVSGVTITGGGGVTQGGGVFSGGRLTLRDAAVTGNAASAAGSTTSRQGGGVFVNDHARLERVLIAGNTLTSKAGDTFAPQGGGLFVNDDSTLENVTITGNTIDGSAGGSSGPQGGGLFVNDAVTMGGITVANNTAVDADSQGGGIFYNDDTTVHGVIVAGNRGGGVPDECYTNDIVVSDGTNLATNAADCGFSAGGDLSADPLLAPLADTGGPSDTHALGAGSPALDRIPFASCPSTDQRGLPRAGAGAACDIGAHENGAPVAAPPPPAAPPAPAPVTVAKPTPPAFVAAAVFRLPSTKRCVSRRNFRIRLRQPRGVTLKEARVFVNAKRVRVVRGKRLTAPVDLRGLPKGRFTVKVTVTATDGRKLTEKRRYRTCTPKRR